MRRIPQYKESLKIVRSSLEAETNEVVQVSNRLNDNLVAADRKIWLQTLVIWAVVIICAILYFLVLHDTITKPIIPQTFSTPQDITSRPQSFQLHSKVSPPASEIPAQADLLQLLNQIREAQSKKDIRLFLETYSPTFPNLAKKRKQTLNIWKRYDYLESLFQVNNIQQENADLIVGNITWNIKAQDRKTGIIKIFSKSYHVNFSKKSGKWLIQKLEPVESKNNQNINDIKTTNDSSIK